MPFTQVRTKISLLDRFQRNWIFYQYIQLFVLKKNVQLSLLLHSIDLQYNYGNQIYLWTVLTNPVFKYNFYCKERICSFFRTSKIIASVFMLMFFLFVLST